MTNWTAGDGDVSCLGAGKIVEGPHICPQYSDSFRVGPGWNIMVQLERFLRTCMTYTIAECTVNKLLMMDRRTVRNM